MARLRMLGFAVVAIAMTALAIVGVNAFVPWLMHALMTKPRWAQLLSNLSWLIPVWLGVFIPIGFGVYTQRRKPRPAPSARLTLRRPLR